MLIKQLSFALAIRQAFIVFIHYLSNFQSLKPVIQSKEAAVSRSLILLVHGHAPGTFIHFPVAIEEAVAGTSLLFPPVEAADKFLLTVKAADTSLLFHVDAKVPTRILLQKLQVPGTSLLFPVATL